MMNMKRIVLISTQLLLLFLLLPGSSNSLYSANKVVEFSENSVVNRELLPAIYVGEQVDNLFDSILPSSRNPFFFKAGFHSFEGFNARILNHTVSSLSYIKRSRHIFPNLGVKEVIFPFHVFL